MAIMGLLVHSLPEETARLEAAIAAMPEMTTYGIHQNEYIVVVIDAPSGVIEQAHNRVHRLEGVLTTYVTSLSVEDEL